MTLKCLKGSLGEQTKLDCLLNFQLMNWKWVEKVSNSMKDENLGNVCTPLCLKTKIKTSVQNGNLIPNWIWKNKTMWIVCNLCFCLQLTLKKVKFQKYYLCIFLFLVKCINNSTQLFPVIFRVGKSAVLKGGFRDLLFFFPSRIHGKQKY